MACLRLEGSKQMCSCGMSCLSSLFLLTMTKLLVHGVEWSTGLIMPVGCIFGNFCLLIIELYTLMLACTCPSFDKL